MVYWQRYLLVAWLVLRETAAVSAQVMCTPLNHTPGMMHVCLAVTCHLHFWQNDQDLLRAAAVSREWSTYQTDTEISVSADSWPWRRNILSPVLRGLEPETFRSQVLRSNHWTLPAPQHNLRNTDLIFFSHLWTNGHCLFGYIVLHFRQFEYTTWLCFWYVVT